METGEHTIRASGDGAGTSLGEAWRRRGVFLSLLLREVREKAFGADAGKRVEADQPFDPFLGQRRSTAAVGFSYAPLLADELTRRGREQAAAAVRERAMAAGGGRR